MSFHGLTVLSLESRMALPVQKLIEKFDGKAMVAPTLKEVPLEDNTEAFQAFEKLEAGKFDLFILMTGVGLRTFLKILETKFPKDRILQAFQKTKVVVRGPKPTSVCKINQISIAVTVPPPNTWQEILQILSDENLLSGKRVALLEYGKSDPNFLEELRERGAELTPVKVYQWDLPDDLSPLKQAIQNIIAGKVDLLLLTSAVQMDHLLRVAADEAKELELRRALARVGVISIGPTTSANLRDKQIFPDAEVTPNKMDALVELAAKVGEEIVRKKRIRVEKSWVRIEEKNFRPPLERGGRGDFKKDISELFDSQMLRACRRQPNERVPIWLMRQAGRYMAEYQLVRHGMDFLQLCKTPDLVTQVTIDAVERLGVDAAIIFADILLIVEPMGLPLEFKESMGPVISAPIRSAEDIQNLKPVEVKQSLKFVLEAIRQVRRSMDPRIPLIGFCGAPFTVAAYMIEGKGSRNYIPTKSLMHEESKAWHQLMEKLTTASIDYLKAQVEAGCQILQVFDSWVGCLSPEDYQQFVLPHTQRLFSSLPKEIPTIHFGTGTATLLDLQKQAGGDVIGLDWRMEIQKTWDHLGDVAVQGNLDPAILFCKPEIIFQEAGRILEAVGSRPGFIFNLGHGILPETPVDHVMALVDFVHEWKV